MEKFVSDNWKGLLGLMVYIAVGYAGYKELQTKVYTNERRLQTYIKVIKAQGDVIHKQNVRIAVLEINSDCNN